MTHDAEQAYRQWAWETAWALKHGADLEGFDSIDGWNPEMPPKDYQFRGIAWLWLQPKSLLLDSVGTGKTVHGLGLAQLHLLHKQPGKVLILCPAANVYGTWVKDGFQKFVPDMPYAVAASGMTKAQRRKVYNDPSWQVLLSNHETFWRDQKELLQLGFTTIIFDEADVLRRPSNKSYQGLLALTAQATRITLMTATPINNVLGDLHALMVLLGLEHLVGDEKWFKRRYIDVEFVERWIGRKKKQVPIPVGYKNLAELKAIIAPYYLRRTKADLPTSDIPELLAQEKWMYLTEEQKEVYQQLERQAEQLSEMDRPGMDQLFLKLRMCCTSTALVDTIYGDHSAKLDWLIHQLQTDWSEEKVVVFSNWKDALYLIARRLDAIGVGHVTMTSDISHKQREVLRQQFWTDPACRVVLGTTAIEKGLNLQCSRTQVNVDMLFNPQRHEQLAGRVARSGSIHDEAFAFSLLAYNTVDHAVVKTLGKKAALSNFMFDDASALMAKFASTLSNFEMKTLLLGRGVDN